MKIGVLKSTGWRRLYFCFQLRISPQGTAFGEKREEMKPGKGVKSPAGVLRRKKL